MNSALFSRLRARRKSVGVAIITAIFLLVALAGLAVAVVTLTTAQQDGAARDLQGERTYQAAKAGIEWALYRSLRGADTNSSLDHANNLGCPGTLNVTLPKGATFSGLTVTVTCTVTAGLMGNTATDPTAGHFVITSVACNQPSAGICPNPAPGIDYIQRRITAQL
ncbi:agglutinin biogenesis protein MshP [Duganella callida]|uniref:Agglutinin biogenesis protein MshP n=1 Tax=Duganella callida TaxID=2561932 RepID=A0A4Y9SJC8_9BURK|nr:agglutinin biogenesis protein MshP [Duganella callida]TFW22390.1 agglutinin biogenesis protein MshP [Duganella callida]